MTVAEDVKKESVYSVEKSLGKAKLEQKRSEEEPKDKFFFVHILFVLLGLVYFIPFTFFVTANAYWMYKFRNVSAETTDTDARTPLQTHFAPGCTMTNAIPMVICILISTFFGHKIKARRRVLIALTTVTLCFVVATGFIKIYTDSWQGAFFGLTMTTLTILNGANFVIAVGVIVILSKFPQYYMKIYIVGQGFAGICNSLLQIASLATGTSTTTSALLYFLIGTGIMTLTLILFYLSKYNHLFNYHVKSVAEDTHRDLMSFTEMKELFKIIWPIIVVLFFIELTVLPTHTAITSLVVSEDYGSGSQWTDKYFVPTITFLYSDIMSLFGRIAFTKVKKTVKGTYLSLFMFARMLIFVPLIYFCNAHPRHHIPLLLPHDWQYILVLGVFNFTNGFFISMLFLDIGKLVPPEKVEKAFMVSMSCSAVIGAALSPISLFAVDLL